MRRKGYDSVTKIQSLLAHPAKTGKRIAQRLQSTHSYRGKIISN